MGALEKEKRLKKPIFEMIDDDEQLEPLLRKLFEEHPNARAVLATSRETGNLIAAYGYKLESE
jgi:hypothetical protein